MNTPPRPDFRPIAELPRHTMAILGRWHEFPDGTREWLQAPGEWWRGTDDVQTWGYITRHDPLGGKPPTHFRDPEVPKMRPDPTWWSEVKRRTGPALRGLWERVRGTGGRS